MTDCFIDLAFAKQGVAKIAFSFGPNQVRKRIVDPGFVMILAYLQDSLVMKNCFIDSSFLQNSIAEMTVGNIVIRIHRERVSPEGFAVVPIRSLMPCGQGQ